MGCDMHPQIVEAQKALVAHFALVRFLTCVQTHVAFQAKFLSKIFTANTADIGLESCVFHLMLSQKIWSCELFAALLALVWFLPRVTVDVPLEVTQALEFVAAFFTDVNFLSICRRRCIL